MRSSFRFLWALGLTVALAGCADMVTGGPLIRPGEPQGTIRVLNATSDQLHAVLISSCDASTYGLNRLPSGMAIPPGGSYSFTVSAGCWDVAAGTLGVGDARGRIRVAAGRTGSIQIN
ncbi:hypothetical protein GGQ87_001866 [Brevundimonas alba]|uniref:Lipoprotein n=1 Tax=Brevundimonas alba TaxID=74314 RepID=A0A7X5YKV9_9CAUL|nr:hypothetical protein [Brevundimonas alba]NJC41608.1 hypothetical protein [Brevundimonas alba]